jgi:hypothetical protein
MRPWSTIPILFLGLLFLLMPTWVALGEDTLWWIYGFGPFWAVVIGVFARRWFRTTVVERGPDYRVIRVDHLRGRKRSSEASQGRLQD